MGSSQYLHLKNYQLNSLELKEKIIDVCEEHINDEKSYVFLVKGEAGVGKSVVLSSVFNRIQELTKKSRPFCIRKRTIY